MGGLGIILLGMDLLTQGLKRASGPSLRALITRATESRRRAFLTGIGVTALVQSSSAVALATLGFVSAGLMSLGQALPLVFGSNIGTTLTAWLVAVLGFKLQLTEFMLPMIGLGVALKLFAGRHNLSHYGLALAGLGLFFFGLDFIRGAFDGLSQALPLRELGTGAVNLILFTIAGVGITLLTQSSSATLAIALSMISTETIGLSAACALVVGANIGTTTTALLASIGATPNAKRIALAHLVFNTQTALVGILLLILVAQHLDNLLRGLDPVYALALFHTLFNVIGVLLIWPITAPLERWLEKRFQSRAEIDSQPQFIAKPLLVSPDLAVEGINRELTRANTLSSALARAALSSEGQDKERLEESRDGLYLLLKHIFDFNQALAREHISDDIAQTLPLSLRVGRYLNEIGRISAELPEYQTLLDQISDIGMQKSIQNFKIEVVGLIDLCEISSRRDLQGIDAHRAMRELRLSYQGLKKEVLEKTVLGSISTDECERLLEYCSLIRRLANQADDVSSHWSSTLPMQHREPIADAVNL